MPSPEKSIRGIFPLQRDKSVEEKLGLISACPNLNMGSAELDENGLLLVHAVSYHPNEKFECACPTVSKIRRDYAIPREYCYCCGEHGDVIDLCAKLFHIGLQDAVKKLMEDFGIDPDKPPAAAILRKPDNRSEDSNRLELYCFRIICRYLHLLEDWINNGGNNIRNRGDAE